MFTMSGFLVALATVAVGKFILSDCNRIMLKLAIMNDASRKNMMSISGMISIRAFLCGNGEPMRMLRRRDYRTTRPQDQGTGKAPTSKLQHPEKHQNPSSKDLLLTPPVGDWCLKILWTLDVGWWCFIGSWSLVLCPSLSSPHAVVCVSSFRNSIVSNPFCLAVLTITSTFVAADSSSNSRCATLRVK